MISIITVVYNGEKTIKRTIESVCKQSILPKEYIIVDGKSTDRTLNIIKESQVLYPFIKIISEKDKGIYDAMNKGIEASKGEIIGIINSDDWYEVDALKNVMDLYVKNKEGVYCGIQRYWVENKEFYLERVNHQFINKKMLPHPSIFISKSLYNTFGKYNLNYKFSADLDLLIRYIKKNIPFYYLDKVISNFTLGGVSSTKVAALESIQVRFKHGYISKKEYNLKKMRLKISQFIELYNGTSR